MVKRPAVTGGLNAITQDGAGRSRRNDQRPERDSGFGRDFRDLNIELPVRAAIGSSRNGRPAVFGIQLERLDNRVEDVHTVDLACHAVRFAWDGAKAFGEIKQTIHTPGVVVEHQQCRT